MNRMIQMLLAVAAASLPLACPAQQGAVQSLRGTDAAAEDPVFTERGWQGKSPGNQKAIPRTYSTQPPLIPHSIEGLGEATLGDNPCLACHGLDAYRLVGAPRLGDRHFVGADPKSGKVAGARHACAMCHVPQADAKPLVDNLFRGDRIVTPAAAKKR